MQYLDLNEAPTSPIIMSHRLGDRSSELMQMSAVIAKTYREWGYAVPEGLMHGFLPDSPATDS